MVCVRSIHIRSTKILQYNGRKKMEIKREDREKRGALDVDKGWAVELRATELQSDLIFLLG
ncbi:hypothetical protein TorRG33x02_040180 [Trema orientale]|uniref:Uncharacterized protein n=1 Tax=Trema orientale TaxID=63057 RepID=A0A2P5FR05_TREOI|nr:hypothetical protein TorRG33x02_040180 [Trema orientale]